MSVLNALKNDKFILQTLNSVDKSSRSSLRFMYIEIYSALLKESFDKLFESKKKSINKRFESSRPKYPFQRSDAAKLTDEEYLKLSESAQNEYDLWDKKVKTKDNQIKIARKQAISRAETDAIEKIHESIHAAKGDSELLFQKIRDLYSNVNSSKETNLYKEEKIASKEDSRNAKINKAGYDPSNTEGIAGAAIDQMEKDPVHEGDAVGREGEDFISHVDDRIYDSNGLELVKRRRATEIPIYHPYFKSSEEARQYIQSLIDNTPSVEDQNKAKSFINSLMARHENGNRGLTISEIAEQVKSKENELHEKISKEQNNERWEKLKSKFFGTAKVSQNFTNFWWKDSFPKTIVEPAIPVGPEVKNTGTAVPLRGFKNGKPMEADAPRELRRDPKKITAKDLGVTERQKRIFDRVATKIKHLIIEKETYLREFKDAVNWEAVHSVDIKEIDKASKLAYKNIETHARLVTALKNFKNLKEKFMPSNVDLESNFATGSNIGNSEESLSFKKPEADQVVKGKKILSRASINFDIRYSIPLSALGTLIEEVPVGSRVDREGLHKEVMGLKTEPGLVMRSLELSSLRIPSAEDETKRMFKFFLRFTNEAAGITAPIGKSSFVDNNIKKPTLRDIKIMKTNFAIEQFKFNLHSIVNTADDLSQHLFSKISSVLDKVVPVDGKEFKLKADPSIQDFVANSNLTTKSMFLQQLDHTHGCAI